MRPLCYICALASAHLPIAEELVTRARALALAALSSGLGAVAVGGCRLMDSRSALLGTVGSAVVLGVVVLHDVLRPPVDPVLAAVEALRREVEAQNERVDILEARLAGIAPRSSAHPDKTGSGRAL